MALAASQLVQGARVLELEEHLHPLQLRDLAADVPAQLFDLRRLALALVQHRRVEGHEAVVLRAHQHHLLEHPQALAAGQLHQDGVVELNRLEVELLQVLHLVHLDQVPHPQIHQVVVALGYAEVRRGKGDEEVELGPVLLQMLEGGPRDESSQ